MAATLNALAGDGVFVLHDRKPPGADGRASRANIDHIAITAAGVWVIDAKTHKGTLEIRRSGGLLTPRTEALFIANRDRTSLIDGLGRQVAAVQAVLDEVAADVPVRGALCFVGTDLPWTAQSIRGTPLVGTRGLVKLMNVPGVFEFEERQAVATYLNQRLQPA